MKTQFIVLGLQDTGIVKAAWLSSTGLQDESKYYVVGVNEGYFDTYNEAIKRAEEVINNYQDGIEIKQIFH